MSRELSLGGPIILDPPPKRRSLARYATVLVAMLFVGGGVWGWSTGFRPAFLESKPLFDLQLVEVDEGDVVEYVVENGTLESGSNTIVRCEVEALTGTVGGSSATGGTGQSGSSGSGSGTGTSGSGSSAGGQGGSGGAGGSGGNNAQTTTPSKSKSSSKSKSGSSKSGSSSKSSSSGSSGGSGSSSSSSSSSSGSSGSSSSSGGGSGSGASGSSSGSSSSSSTSGGGTTAGSKPVIRSFAYMVTPHVPLRPVTKSSTTTTAKSGATDQAGGGGGGGGGNRGGGGRGGRGGGRGGRGGGGGGGMMDEEKPGSTRIVTILPEGSIVHKGDIVCQLDSSAFEDELKAQLIRFAQSQAWVQQAQAIFDVNEITLREYRDGIYPQDLQLIRQYIQTCQIEKDRAARNLEWSRDMAKKGFRTQAQLKADMLADQQSGIALSEANGMLVRLEKFTGPKIIKSLEAKLEAIRSDKSSQEKSFALDSERLARLQKNIKNCTLRAPGVGLVVYVNQTNGWGRVESQIEQGVTVREGQQIFQLPDPKNMRVKTRINETKVAHLRRGQGVRVKLDAFPGRPMRGRVAEVTAISTPVNGPFSDVRVYYANVEIEDEIEDLRPGMTAEVYFATNFHSRITRVPVQAIKVIDGKSYVALHQPGTAGSVENPWRWTPVVVGLSDTDYVEVISGVKRGDLVVADARLLPTPEAPPQENAGEPSVTSAG